MNEIKLAKTMEEREAFLLFLDDFPLVIRSVTQFPADQVCHRAMILADTMEGYTVPAELDEIDKAILKAAIEKSRWLDPYEGQSDASRNRKPQKLSTLRACAVNLETIGIEVDFIPV